ncbi:MAG TPA: His/Gly/Thr/Pro-type tRNA ligase C-terminal domain-containing protein, partial [Spirochaetota bacterium]|nr:His/Gly/Thr/Pro-type tRNA ligase C-terminal domain-containing protein [Spirochaetota bacterium]
DNAVTVRERDSMTQTRVPVDSLVSWLAERLD